MPPRDAMADYDASGEVSRDQVTRRECISWAPMQSVEACVLDADTHDRIDPRGQRSRRPPVWHRRCDPMRYAPAAQFVGERVDAVDGYSYEPSADGQRFLVHTILQETAPITLFANWQALDEVI